MDGRYPVMPPGVCYLAAEVLAACYPELRHAEGTRTFTVSGRPETISHAWNVTADGEIWDATLTPGARLAAWRGRLKITYAEAEGQRSSPPGEVDGELLAEVREQFAGLTGKAKREAIEFFGRCALAALDAAEKR